MPISGVGFLDGRNLVAGGKRKQALALEFCHKSIGAFLRAELLGP